MVFVFSCLTYFTWASLVAQLVKNLPETRATWVRSLGWEDPLEKGKATRSRILAWRIPWTVGLPEGSIYFCAFSSSERLPTLLGPASVITSLSLTLILLPHLYNDPCD